MKYRLHPQAALEHEKQVAFYEERAPGLGRRYHAALLMLIAQICQAPQRHKIVAPPAVRRASLHEFPFHLFYRTAGDELQVLAVAHHRRHPSYWANRRF